MSSELSNLNTENTQLTPTYNSEEFFALLLSDSFSKMEPEIKLSFTAGLIKFKQEKGYRLTEEQYAKWPKIYSVALSGNNKQIVTLEFRNNPNLDALKNILHLYSAEFIEELLSYSSIADSLILVRIETESLKVIAHLCGIYMDLNKDAGVLLWEVFRHIVEDHMDHDPKNPRWKEALSYKIDFWADSPQNIDGENCIAMSDVYGTKGEYAKRKYMELTEENKQKFLHNFIDLIVKQKAAQIYTSLPQLDRYETIETAFSTPEKCLKYIQHNLPSVSNFALSAKNIVVDVFSKKFEPTVWQYLLDNNIMKHVKVDSTGAGAMLSILGRLEIIAKNNQYVQAAGFLLDTLKLYTSVGYEINENSDKKEPLDVNTIATLIIYKDVICNYKTLSNLTTESYIKLVKFYSDVLYAMISKNMYSSSDNISSEFLRILSQESNMPGKLGLESASKILLELNTNEKITIQEFISQFNLTQCYNEILEVLSGKFVRTEEIVLNITESTPHDLSNEQDSSIKILESRKDSIQNFNETEISEVCNLFEEIGYEVKLNGEDPIIAD